MAVGKTLPLCEKGDMPSGKGKFQLWPPADKISRRLLIGRDCHLDQSEAYDVS